MVSYFVAIQITETLFQQTLTLSTPVRSVHFPCYLCFRILHWNWAGSWARFGNCDRHSECHCLWLSDFGWRNLICVCVCVLKLVASCAPTLNSSDQSTNLDLFGFYGCIGSWNALQCIEIGSHTHTEMLPTGMPCPLAYFHFCHAICCDLR